MPKPTPSPEGKTIAVTVAGGKIQSPPNRIEVAKGERVTVVVTADVQDEVHVHGYDKSGDVAPGRPSNVQFVADQSGLYEVELEEAELQLFQLLVR